MERNNPAMKSILLAIVIFILVLGITFWILSHIPFSISNIFLLGIILTGISSLCVYIIFHKELPVLYFAKNPSRSAIVMVCSFFSLAYFLVFWLLVLLYNEILNNLVILVISFVLVMMVSTYLPGTMLLHISGIEEYLSTTENFAISVLISILITGTAGFVGFVAGSLSIVGSIVFFGIFAIVLILYVRKQRVSRLQEDDDVDSKHIRIDAATATAGLLLVLFLYIVYWTLHATMTGPILPMVSDEPFHLGLIERIENGIQSWQEVDLQMMVTPSYPYLFHLYVLVNSLSSGIQNHFAYLLLSFVLIPLPLVSFYSLAGTITKDRRMSILSAIVFQIISGFGWILAVIVYNPAYETGVIYVASTISCDIIYSTWFPIIVAPYLIDLTIFFSILNLLLKKEQDTRKLISLQLVMITLGILVHFEKVILLSAIISVLAVLQFMSNRNWFRVNEYGKALFFACAVVAMWDILAPLKLYTAIYVTPLFVLALAGSFIAIISSERILSHRIRRSFMELFSNRSNLLWSLFVAGLVMISLVELITGMVPTYYCGIIPLYLIPSKLGWAFVFAVTWLMTRVHQDNKKWEPLFILTFVVIFIELVLYHLPISIYQVLGNSVEEFRFIRDITWPFMAILGGIGFSSIFSKISSINTPSTSRRASHLFVTACLITLIITTGSISNMLKVDYQEANSVINQDALGVLTFLDEYDFTSGSAIFAEDALSRNLFALTGVLIYTPSTEIYGNILTRGTDISGILFVLDYLNISIIAVKNDNAYFLLGKVLSFSDIIFQDDIYVVYMITDLIHPDTSSQLTFLQNRISLPEAYEMELNTYSIWSDDFSSSSEWIFSSASQGVTSTSIGISNGSYLHISGTTNGSNPDNVFYQTPVDMLELEGYTHFWLKFKTLNTTSIVIQIFFEGGRYVNALHENSPYLNSVEWDWSHIIIPETTEKITSIKIGITNRFHESATAMEAYLDFMSFDPTHYNEDRIISTLSYSGLNFESRYLQDSYQALITDTVITVESAIYGESMPDQILTLAETNSKIVVMTNLFESNWIRDYVNISNLGESILVNQIQFPSMVYEIPEITMDNFNLTGCDVESTFEGGQSIPFLISVDISENASISFLNINPLLDAINPFNYRDSTSRIIEVFRETFIEFFNLSTDYHFEREFYVKATGPIQIDGTIAIPISQIFSSINGLDEGILRNDSVISIEGSVELSSNMFGYLRIDLTSVSIVEIDGNRITLEDSLEQFIIISSRYLYGEGFIFFTSVSSGFPYRLSLSNSEYQSNGTFEMQIIPLGNSVCLIHPTVLEGFH